MGRQCLAGEQHDRDVDALPVQFDQQVDAGNLRPVAMEDDDVGIAGGIRCADQRGDIPESPDGKALLRQYISQGPAIDRALLDEKDANGVWLADGGEKRGRRCLQGDDILFKSGHLKSLPLVSVSESKTGRESTPRRRRAGSRLPSPGTMLTAPSTRRARNLQKPRSPTSPVSP